MTVPRSHHSNHSEGVRILTPGDNYSLRGYTEEQCHYYFAMTTAKKMNERKEGREREEDVEIDGKLVVDDTAIG